ncbi:MAG TPA: mechanosensitive ion channel family protein [Acidobacteriaceae bacterium]|jgi:small conductance mechanosensitive channel|nr:mechanosensitive ion channel family protein [Acidobacteriaceae bacterium]
MAIRERANAGILTPMGMALMFLSRREFFTGLGDKYLLDLQDFLHDKLPKLLVVALISWALLWLLRLVTNRILRMAEHPSSTVGHLAQVRTLTSVIRATGVGIIIFLAGLQVMPILGFNLGPLLTSAGVAGVAIGLAAQNIVKDCFNGFLILVEDQYNVGDVISIAGVSGTVEAMTLRRTQVRGGDGTLYIVPNSQITTVANQTRDFSVATINVSVDFSANPDKVLALLKEVAMSVRNDPAYSSVFLADPTLLGVDAIKGSQVIYPVQLKTKANQQWAAMRETQRRIRVALEEHGMLPGDPLRVFTASGSTGSTGAVEEAEAQAQPDPTAAKPNEVNPFTGEGT